MTTIDLATTQQQGPQIAAGLSQDPSALKDGSSAESNVECAAPPPHSPPFPHANLS